LLLLFYFVAVYYCSKSTSITGPSKIDFSTISILPYGPDKKKIDREMEEKRLKLKNITITILCQMK